jgi:tRNA(Ile2) C34 agmatinyltransferase TiaS
VPVKKDIYAIPAGTKIMAAGLVDEGMEYERMESEITRLNALLSANKPVCPSCHAILIPSIYQGYYESFAHWECDCDEEDMKKINVERHRGP